MRAVLSTSTRSTPSALAGVGLATLFSTACTWFLQALAGRMLSLSAFTDFMGLWGLFFATLGVLQGLQQEVTRSISSARHGDPARGLPILAALVIGICGSSLVWGSSIWWRGYVFEDQAFSAVAATALAVMIYALFNAVGGGLAGRGDWPVYARLIGLEGLVRSLLVVAVLLSDYSVAAVTWALAGGGLVAVFLVLPPRSRAVLTERGDASIAQLLRGAGNAMLASGCSAVLIAGFPLLLKLTAREPLDDSAAILIAVVVATRAPILITLNAYQAATIARFVGSSQKGLLLRDLIRLSLLVGGLMVAAAGAAYVAGPRLLQLLYGSRFVAHGPLFVGLVLCAGLMALLMVSGSACVAMRLHRAFAAGWLVSTVTTIGCLYLDLGVETRTLVALSAGPLSGLCLHLTLVARRVKRPVLA